MSLQKLVARVLVQTSIWPGFVGLLLFVAAANWRWVQAWAIRHCSHPGLARSVSTVSQDGIRCSSSPSFSSRASGETSCTRFGDDPVEAFIALVMRHCGHLLPGEGIANCEHAALGT